MLLLLVASVLAGNPPPASPPRPPPGAWSVIESFQSSTCRAPNDVGGVRTNRWLVTANADGDFSVAVEAPTSFPKLIGRTDGEGRFVLAGIEAGGVLPDGNRLAMAAPGNPVALYRMGRIEFDLQFDGSSWVGSRRVLLIDGPSPAGESAYFTACLVEYTVTAAPG